MNNDINQPKEFDAVLGGKTPPPVDGVVLGGFDGVKNRLQSFNVEAQIMATSEALNYGKPGLDLVTKVLGQSPAKVRRLIARLLREQGGIEGKQFLLDYDPWLFFTVLIDWDKDDSFSNKVTSVEVLSRVKPTLKLKPSASKQLAVSNRFRRRSKIDSQVGVIQEPDELKSLIKNNQCENLEALICEINTFSDYAYANIMHNFTNILVEAPQKFPNFKALFLGGVKDSSYGTHDYSRVYLCNIYPVLEAFPKLEVLHLSGHFGDTKNILVHPKQLKLNNLKTLIIEKADLTDSRIAKICEHEYPSLEYLELWLCRKNTSKLVEILSPILLGQACPNLLYLGLIGSIHTHEIIQAIATSPIIKRLKVLDLRGGNLRHTTQITRNPLAFNNLHILNISENRLKVNVINKPPQLKCQVIAYGQLRDRYYPGCE